MRRVDRNQGDRSNILSADIPDPAADLSSLVLTLQDLPPSFTEMPSDDVANFRNQLSQGPDFKPASLFAYQKIDPKLFELQFLIGFTVQLSDPIQQATFDRAIREGMAAKSFSQGLNSNKESPFTHPAALTKARQDWRGIGWVEKSRKNRKYTNECRYDAVSRGKNRGFYDSYISRRH